MRVLLITDSLGLPRPAAPLECTWTHRLAQQIWGSGGEVVVLGRRGLTAKMIDDQILPEVADYAPDVVVVQVGIVDCCRRPYSNRVRAIIERSILVRRWVARHRYAITQRVGRPEVTAGVFIRSLGNIARSSRAGGRRLAFIEIAPAGKFLASRIYGVREDIGRYNRMIAETARHEGFSYLSPYAGFAAEELTLAGDGHHLTPAGHHAVYETVSAFLRETNDPASCAARAIDP